MGPSELLSQRRGLGALLGLAAAVVVCPNCRPAPKLPAHPVATGEAIFVALNSRDHERLKQLLRSGAAANSSHNDRSALAFATLHRDAEAERDLIAAGALVDVADPPYGMRPLEVAAINDDLKSARLLLQAGADPNRQDRHGVSALSLSTSEAMAQLLVQHKADVRVRDNDGTGCANSWARVGALDLTSYAVKLGLPIDSPDRFGMTPLMYAVDAAARNAYDARYTLLQARSELSPASRHLLRLQAVSAVAEERRDESVAGFLLAAGADPYVVNGKGASAWSMARRAHLGVVVRRITKVGRKRRK
ncbi:MAG: ankyrin repeat domain-containing protein [Fimbriimonadaceae bacterium]